MMQCSHCGSSRTKRNGRTHYGKQNHFCHTCRRQFVAGGQERFVSEKDKAVINKLLLERISLAGICRACDVSQTWLLGYLKELYGQLPDELNADPQLPDLDDYLAERMDEEITRLTRLKNTSAYAHYLTVADIEAEIVAEPPVPESAVPALTEFENNGLLLNELHEKERGLRVALYGLQLERCGRLRAAKTSSSGCGWR